MNSERNIIYIIGVGRSGTSMLMTLLNGHSEIAFTPETHFLRFYLGNEQIQKTFEQKGPNSFQKLIDSDDYFKRLNISSEKLLDPYLSKRKPFDLQEVYLDILERYQFRKGKKFIGDKDPRYLDYLETVKEVTPNAKIIQIYRDPRDVVLSKSKANWASHRPYWVNALISQIQMKQGRDLAKNLFGRNYYELSYESLVENPEKALTKLLSFLNLNFEKEMLDLRKSASELVDESEIQWKDNTFKPIMKSNSEKWRNQFSADQIRTVEIICEEWFEKLGYKQSDLKGNSVKSTFWKMVLKFEPILNWIYKKQLKRQMLQNITQN